jgi:Flp pilus assembly protein TadD
MTPPNAIALEQLASLFADAGDSAQLEATVTRLREVAPHRPGTHYYGAVAAFLRGKPDDTVRLAERTIGVDPAYAPVYDLLGAAYTKLGQAVNARDAFLTSLRLDAHDSTAYTNLGLLELAAGNRAILRRPCGSCRNRASRAKGWRARNRLAADATDDTEKGRTQKAQKTQKSPISRGVNGCRWFLCTRSCHGYLWFRCLRCYLCPTFLCGICGISGLSAARV